MMTNKMIGLALLMVVGGCSVQPKYCRYLGTDDGKVYELTLGDSATFTRRAVLHDYVYDEITVAYSLKDSAIYFADGREGRLSEGAYLLTLSDGHALHARDSH